MWQSLKTYMLNSKFRNILIIKLWVHKVYAYAYRVELPDGNYELVPESGGELAEGDVNLVEVHQDPDQSSKDFPTNFASEGKPRSITQCFTIVTPLICNVCAFKFQELIKTLDAWS